jgi:hypothetical protein
VRAWAASLQSGTRLFASARDRDLRQLEERRRMDCRELDHEGPLPSCIVAVPSTLAASTVVSSNRLAWAQATAHRAEPRKAAPSEAPAAAAVPASSGPLARLSAARADTGSRTRGAAHAGCAKRSRYHPAQYEAQQAAPPPTAKRARTGGSADAAQPRSVALRLTLGGLEPLRVLQCAPAAAAADCDHEKLRSRMECLGACGARDTWGFVGAGREEKRPSRSVRQSGSGWLPSLPLAQFISNGRGSCDFEWARQL